MMTFRSGTSVDLHQFADLRDSSSIILDPSGLDGSQHSRTRSHHHGYRKSSSSSGSDAGTLSRDPPPYHFGNFSDHYNGQTTSKSLMTMSRNNFYRNQTCKPDNIGENSNENYAEKKAFNLENALSVCSRDSFSERNGPYTEHNHAFMFRGSVQEPRAIELDRFCGETAFERPKCCFGCLAYSWLNILTAFLCFFPFGPIVAMLEVKARQAADNNDSDRAYKLWKHSNCMTMWSTSASAVLILVVLILVFWK